MSELGIGIYGHGLIEDLSADLSPPTSTATVADSPCCVVSLRPRYPQLDTPVAIPLSETPICGQTGPLEFLGMHTGDVFDGPVARWYEEIVHLVASGSYRDGVPPVCARREQV